MRQFVSDSSPPEVPSRVKWHLELQFQGTTKPIANLTPARHCLF